MARRAIGRRSVGLVGSRRSSSGTSSSPVLDAVAGELEEHVVERRACAA